MLAGRLADERERARAGCVSVERRAGGSTERVVFWGAGGSSVRRCVCTYREAEHGMA